MKESFAIVASLLAIAGNIPYVIDVLKGRVQPHAYTWFVWMLVSGVVFFGQVAKGAGLGAIPTGASEIFTVIIFFLALRNGLRTGFKEVTKLDTVFLIIALLSFIPWIMTNDPTMSVIIVVSIDLIAFVPTLRKTWQNPETETPLLFGSNVLRHILTLFSLQAYNIATTLHSISMIILNTAMTLMIVFPKRGKPKRKEKM